MNCAILSAQRLRTAIFVWAASGLMISVTAGAPLQQGRVTQVIRDVKILPGQAAARPAAINDQVVPGTAVRTGVESRTELTFADLTIARLGANTIFSFDQGSRTIDLGAGAVLLRVPKNSGGAKVTTAAVTAAITGTTMLAEFHAGKVYKFVMLEGTATICPVDGGRCVNLGPGEMLTGVPGQPLGEPVSIDLKALVATSQLLEGFGPLGSEDLIQQEIQNQQNAGNAPQLLAYNQATSEQLNAIDQRVAVAEAIPTPSPSVTPVPSPSPSVTPVPSPSPSASPSPSPSVSPTPSPSPTPQPTPTKFGTPPVITSANLSTIDGASVIQTDPSITRNGETGYGRIYRAPATDGSRSLWLFGSTSAFDMQVGTEDVGGSFLNFAAFKFQNILLAGDPLIDTTNGGANVLALIGVNGITSPATGGLRGAHGVVTALTFTGIDALLLATQNGSIDLGADLFFNGPRHIVIYARGAGSNLTLGSAITASDRIDLAAEGDMQVNGNQTTAEFGAIAGNNFLAGTGVIQASSSLNVRANNNLNFDVNQFAAGANTGFLLNLEAGNMANLSVDGDGSVFSNAGSIFIRGLTINLTGAVGTLISLDNATPITLMAGIGGINGSGIGFDGGNLTLMSDGDIQIYSATIPFVNNSRPIQGSIIAAGFFDAVMDVDTAFLQAGTSVNVGGNLDFGNTLNAGTTISIGNSLRGENATAGGDISANTVSVRNITTPGVLNVGSGGIYPILFNPGGASLQHIFNVDSIVSLGGINFSGNEFSGIDGNFSGGLLTINANKLTFGPTGGIAFANFNGADGFSTPDDAGGSGGTFVVNADGNILVNAAITATTGLNNDVAFGGAGGTVELHSSNGSVAVNNRIEVSSHDLSAGRVSASGGNITLTSAAASGSAINIGSSGQLLSLLDVEAPGPGGQIVLRATGNASSIDINNSAGAITADRGLIDIRQLGNLGSINLTSPNLSADVIKVGALGANGTLTITGGAITADTLLRLYAGGSNGSIIFAGNVTLTSQSNAAMIAANAVTILNGVVVTIGGQDPALIFTNLANYSGSGGNGSTTGMFGGAGASTQPFANAPPFDGTTGALTVTYTGATNGLWNNPAVWNPMFVPNNGNGGFIYDVVFGSGSVTQNIAGGVTIEQLLMNGGTIVLSNPLTLNAGLQFTGGAINGGTLDLAGMSTQNALMNVSSTTINNSGTYALALTGGNVFSGPSSIFNNSGTLTKSGTGTVSFNISLNNTGTLAVQNGTLRLTPGGTIGGAFSIAGGALLELPTSYTFANGTQISGAGSVQLDDNTTQTLAGVVTNNGNIVLTTNGNATTLRIDTGATLTGTGTVTLTRNAGATSASNSRIDGSGTLSNQGTIQGEGNVGLNGTTIANGAGGIIQANVGGRVLVLDPNAANGLTNAGVLRATSGGVLQLSGNGGGDFMNTGAGSIQANGSGSEVQLLSGARISGGTLSTSGGGVFRTLNSQTVFLDGLTNAGSFIGNDNSATVFTGTISNSGDFTFTTNGNVTALRIDTAATLSGAGTVMLTRNAGATSVSNAGIRGAGTLTNQSTIQGEGFIGANETTIVNQASGIIQANVSGRSLQLDPVAGTGTFVNQGLLRASNGGVLQLTGNGGGTFNNTGGIIRAEAGSEVQLFGNVTVSGGTLSTVGAGALLRTVNGNTVTLDNLTLAGTYTGSDNSTTILSGTINNTGDLTLTTDGNLTHLRIDGSATLQAGGTVTLTRNAGATSASNSRIDGTGTLTNQSTIQGEGNVGANETTLINQSNGIIQANVAGRTLVLDAVNATNGFSNAGILRATNGGFLQFTGNAGGDFTNTSSGTIQAIGAGSEVRFTTGASIHGGTLLSSAGGIFRTLNGQSITLDSLSNAGNYIGNDNSSTFLTGMINNTGDFTLTTNGNVTDLRIMGNVTLNGIGTVTLTRNSGATSVSNAGIRGSGTLNNANTIQGEGFIGSNETGLVNLSGGMIDANVSGRVLNVDPNAGAGLTNAGTMRASNGGILLLNGNGGGTFTNSGTIAATSGGTLQFNGAVTSSGTVDVGGSTLTGTGNYTQTGGSFILTGGTAQLNSALDFQGGLVDARGTINAAIMNNAMLRPALGGSGLAVTGNVSLLSSSQLIFQLGGLAQGSQYGFLSVNGTVSLGGNLVVSFVNGFQAGNNDSFTVLSSTTQLGGTFANVTSGGRISTSGGATGTFLVNYNGSTIVLSDFMSQGGPVPPTLPGDSATPPLANSGAASPNGATPTLPDANTGNASPTLVEPDADMPARSPRTSASFAHRAAATDEPAPPVAAVPASAITPQAASAAAPAATVQLRDSSQLLDLVEAAQPDAASGRVIVRKLRQGGSARNRERLSAAPASDVVVRREGRGRSGGDAVREGIGERSRLPGRAAGPVIGRERN